MHPSVQSSESFFQYNSLVILAWHFEFSAYCMTQLHTRKLWDTLHSDVSSQMVLSNTPSLKGSTLTEGSQTLLRRGIPLPLMEG